MINTCQQLEDALVGALIVKPEKIINIVDKVKPTDFTNDNALSAYSAIIDEYRKKNPINIVTISSRIPGLGMYLAGVCSDAYPPGAIKFADDIAYRAKTRRVKTGLEAASKESSPEEMLSQAMSIFNQEMSVGKKDSSIKSVMHRVDKIIETNKKQKRIGFSTGFDLHEKLYYKYFPGHIWTIGGFTSVGKTAVMIQKICNMLSNGEGASILLISTEMTEEQIISRIISNFTGIHSMRILTSNYRDNEEENRVDRVRSSLKESSLRIYDEIYDIEDIETAFRRTELQGGVDVGFVDYVQNCKWSKATSQYQEQAMMAKKLQHLAKEVKSTLVCLSQVSNEVGKGNTDQLELKGAGEWAAVSDLGVMLQRNKAEKHRLKYLIKKNRHGALGECGLDFVNEYTSLVEKNI